MYRIFADNIFPFTLVFKFKELDLPKYAYKCILCLSRVNSVCTVTAKQKQVRHDITAHETYTSAAAV